MKRLQKLICGFLAFVMVLTMLPIPAYAEEVEACSEDAHLWGKGVRTEATEDAPAFLTYTCTVCGQSKVEEEEPVAVEEQPCEHSWDDGVSSETVMTYTCTLCGETRTEDIPMEEPTFCADDAHLWDEGVDSETVTTYTCTVCGETKTEELPAEEEQTSCADDAHIWDEGAGSETVITYTCTVCGATREEPIEVEELYTLTDEQRSHILYRDDGEWLFPLPQEYYANITDWNGCRGEEVCLFCGEVHSECQEPAHQDSPYGHWGLDISVPVGTEVYAPRDGVAYWTDDTLILEHPAEDGYAYFSAFTGLDSAAIAAGADVKQGDLIACSTDKLHFAIFMAPAVRGKAVVENPDSELPKIEDCGWLEDRLGTGLIVNGPSPESDAPECDYSAVVSMLEDHLGSVKYFFMPENITTLEEIEPASDVVILTETASGTCGDSLNWVLDSSGLLTISGTGGMYDYDEGHYAPWFAHRSNIYTATIDGATSVGDYAFNDCTSLRTITLSDSVTSIGDNAFAECENLVSTNLPDAVTTIGDYAFGGCKSLCSTDLPDSVTNIGYGAFMYCTGLTSINIPVGVVSLCNEAFGGRTFKDCTSVELIYFNATSMDDLGSSKSVFESVGKNSSGVTVIFGANVTKIPANLFCQDADLNKIEYAPNITKVIFEDNSVCTSIGEFAFALCGAIDSFMMPRNLSTIEKYAFYETSVNGLHLQDVSTWCNVTFNGIKSNPLLNSESVDVYINEKLVTDLVISEGVTNIGAYTFRNCRNLQSITIPSSVTQMGDGAFYGCTALTKINYNATNMHDRTTGGGAFNHSGSASGIKVVVGKNVKRIPAYLFAVSRYEQDCPPITEVLFEDGQVGQSIGAYAFAGCTSLKSIYISNGVTAIEEAAFSGCTALTSVHLSTNLKQMDDAVFSSCTSLNAIEIPASLTKCNTGSSWEDGIFYKCTALKNITFEEGITNIPAHLFYDCDSLEQIVIPNSVITIEQGSFENCDALKSAVLSNNLNSIGERAFSECTALTSVVISEGVGTVESTGAIGTCAFYNCSNLVSCDLPNSITSIASSAFSGCSSLTSMTIPESVAAIGESAFASCSALESVQLSKNLTTIKQNAFSSCVSLTSIEIPASLTAGPYPGGVFVNCPALKNASFGEGTTQIVQQIFYGCDALEYIVIPDSVKRIGASAFEKCNALQYVVLPKSVIEIYSDAFLECENLTDVFYSGTEEDQAEIYVGTSNEKLNDAVWHYNSLGPSAPDDIDILSGFCGDKALWELTKSTGALRIYGEGAMTDYPIWGAPWYSEKVTSVTIEDGITSIGTYAFDGCAMESLTIANTVSSISGSAFSECNNLREVIIPDGVTQIASGAFWCCYNIGELWLPESIEVIGADAFFRCGLDDVFYAGSESNQAEIDMASGNESLIDATWHYNSSPDNGANVSVSYFTRWDAENQIAFFDNVMNYHVTNRTDMSFLDNLDKLLGNYVLVTTEPNQSVSGTHTLLRIEPVDTQAGIVTSQTKTSLTFGEKTYSVSLDMQSILSVAGVENTVLMYHVYNGKIVGFEELGKVKGFLESWNPETQKLAIKSTGSFGPASFYSLSGQADEGTLAFLETNTTGVNIWFIADYNGIVYRLGRVPDYGASDTFDPGENNPAMGYVLSYRDAWDEAYKDFIEAVNQALNEYAGTDEATKDRWIAAEAARMKKNDKESSSKYISGEMKAGHKDLAYKALANYFYDVTSKKVPDLSSIDLSGTMASVKIINSILANIGGDYRNYTFDGVNFSITVFDTMGAHFGSMIIEEEGVSPETVMICDTLEECRETINAYMEEMQDLATNSAYNVATSVYKDILGKPLYSLTSDYLNESARKIEKKLAVKLAEKFSAAGVGELFNVINESYTCYTWVKKAIDAGTKESFEESLSAIVNLKFEDQTITKGVVKQTMRELKGATNKLKRAFSEYIEGTIVEKEESLWRLVVECPVSVKVFNSNGEQIGYVGEDDIWYTDAVYIAQKGSAKEILMLADDIPSLEITATGNGVMSCSFEEFDDAFMPIGRLNYYNIPLTTGKVFTVTLVDDLEANKDTLAIISGNESVCADEYISATENASVVIACSADLEGGTIHGAGTYVCGDAVILSAEPHDGNAFTGWYDGDILVETSYIYEFPAIEDRNLSARFVEINKVYINAIAEEGGVVMGEGTYSKNSTALLTAIAFDGYQFDGWFVGEELLSTEPEYRFLVRENVTVTAQFSGLVHEHTYGDWTDNSDGKNHSRTCSVCGETETASHEVVIDEAVPPTHTTPGLTEGKHCSVCGAVLVAQTEIPPLEADFTLTLDNIGDADTIWVDGRAYPVQKNPDSGSYVALNSGEAKTAVVYSYNAAGEEAHKTYPTGMKVWTLDYQDGSYTATYVPEFENLLQYKGSSIRITGNKGIRMITGVPDGKREQLIQGKLAGYTLEEYGTVLAIADQIENGSLRLEDTYAKSNYAYKRNKADAIFEHSGGLIQYTNVLVGFTMDQCDDDIAMRPYMKLSDKDGDVITLYGGIVYRSIGYIAWQNKDIFPKGSDGYNYIWDIINAVYGDNLPG